MAANLNDSQTAILEIYSSIVNDTGRNNWLLLKYMNNFSDELSLFDYGSGGITELKNKIDDLQQVYIAFCREQVNMEPAFLLINYIPPCVSGVRRARALVRSLRVGATFKKHHTALTVDSLDNLTLDTVYKALAEPGVFESGEMGRTISKSLDVKNKDLPELIVIERRSLSEAHPPASFVVPPMTKSSSVFSNFMRRKKRGEGFHGDEDLPPPTPPKDGGSYDVQTTAHHIFPQDVPHNNLPTVEPMPILRQRTGSLSEFAVISHSGGSDEILVESNRIEDAQMPIVAPLPLLTKWKPEVLDPVERAQRRLEAQQRRAMEEENALRQEAERQVELNRRKEQLLKEEQEAEARRRASLEDELRRAGAERRRRVLLEQGEEARRQREFEERKRLDKERRLEEHKRLEEWRREHARMADEIAQREKELQRQAEDDRRKKIQIAEAKVKRNKHVDSMMTGWVTIQTRDSLSWKRRFFKFVGNTVHFYRTPEDTHQVLDTVELHGKVKRIKEWNEGYEYLEAIPHSFVIEYVDDREPWLMFADSEEEKYKLLGLLYHGAGF